MKYPHFVQPYGEIAGDRFVGFYMPEEDIAAVKEIFPDGCDDYFSEYSLVPEFMNAERTDDWCEKFRKLNDFENGAKTERWNFSDLIHAGYWVIWTRSGENIKYAVLKGKIKPNKHTKIVLLAKAPKSVEKIVEKTWENYCIPIIRIVENNE